MADLQKYYDVIIIGAGLHGICAAHTFLKIDPSLSLLILDEKSSIGGVWSKEQLYPGLRANNLQGYYEFTDFPMLEAGLGVDERGILSGKTLQAYCHAYAKRFDLLGRIRLGVKVTSARNNGAHRREAWTLGFADIHEEPVRSGITACAKLVIATGQASQPLPPSIPGAKRFKKPIIHSADMGAHSDEICSSSSGSHVTVVGGSKSAHDAVYMSATAGKQVTWLTRRTGRGAMPMAKPYTKMGPWSVWLEGLLMTRALSWFGPCPWSDGDGFGWVRDFLHRTRIGMSLVRGYFANMTGESLAQSGILDSKETKKLAPDETLLWYGTQASSLNYDSDFYGLVRSGKVEVIRENIDHLESDEVVLQNGHKFETDLVVCATGYKFGPSLDLQPSEKHLSWGVPVSPAEDDLFPNLDVHADRELLKRFPILAESPSTPERQPELTPWRLWRFIAPPSQVCSSDRSLAFLSTITSYQTTLKCEITSLWAYAYLFDVLKVQPTSEADVTYEAALWSRFGRWRCPMGMQGKIADFLLDAMPYYDLLLRDMGLRSWRKGWGIFGEVFGRWYDMKDYRGLVDEWIAMRRGDGLQKKNN